MIIYRDVKGSKLSNAEVDANIHELEDGMNAALGAVMTLNGEPGQILVEATGPDTARVALPNIVNAPGQVIAVGTVIADAAAAGKVGEYNEVKVAAADALALTSAAELNVLSYALQPGDWQCGGSLCFTGNGAGAATATSYLIGGASLGSATLPGDEYLASVRNAGTSPLAIDTRLALPSRRLNISAETTVYLVAKASFSGGNCLAYGKLWFRRMR
jgi:hypothetical protein